MEGQSHVARDSGNRGNGQDAAQFGTTVGAITAGVLVVVLIGLFLRWMQRIHKSFGHDVTIGDLWFCFRLALSRRFPRLAPRVSKRQASYDVPLPLYRPPTPPAPEYSPPTSLGVPQEPPPTYARAERCPEELVR